LVAKRSSTTRDLSRRIDEAQSRGISDEPTVAAEQILALAAALSAHDRKTRGHAERVWAFSDMIAEKLRLPDDDRDRLRWSALLHDVGKLTVHSDIFNKPGALSDDEWEMMCRHPLEGANLIAPLAAWLGPWANTIAEHHERFDGGGYPFGLAGQEISMGGRIVAVADSYDAMTSLHSCQEPMSIKAARIQLAAHGGAQFDPAMVRAFLAVPVSRLHAVVPLTWIGTLPIGNLGPQLARIADAIGRVGISAVTATACVVALVAGQRVVGSTNPTHLSATQRGVPFHSPRGPMRPTSAGGPGGSGRTAHGGAAGSSSAAHLDLGSGTSSLVGNTRSQQTGSGDAGGGPGSSQPSGGGTDGNTGSTTTVAPGSTPTIPTTTVGGTSPNGSTTTSTTTTTAAPPPPLVAPSELEATSACQVLVGPEVTLSWTASPTTRVTGYVILRSTDRTSSYSSVGSVSGRTTVSFTDTNVTGLDTTYWYEVEAVAGGSSAASSPASATTPTMCLSA
jgi:hypothetical protein